MLFNNFEGFEGNTICACSLYPLVGSKLQKKLNSDGKTVLGRS